MAPDKPTQIGILTNDFHIFRAKKIAKEWGIKDDAHAGKWHRQVSLLSYDKIQEFRAKGAEIEDGAFGENLVVEGFDFAKLPVGTKFRCNDVVLEMTQIGKKCHSDCEIHRITGKCVMPTDGVFAVVTRGGTVRPGDPVRIRR